MRVEGQTPVLLRQLAHLLTILPARQRESARESESERARVREGERARERASEREREKERARERERERKRDSIFPYSIVRDYDLGACVSGYEPPLARYVENLAVETTKFCELTLLAQKRPFWRLCLR